MRNLYSEFLGRLRKALLDPSGRLPVQVREGIVDGRSVDDPLDAFVVRVRDNASTVEQEHIDQLKKSGLAEDQIFEASVCAAYCAGRERYEAVIAALEGSRHEA